MNEKKKNEIRWAVFVPAFALTLLAAVVGIVSNKTLTTLSNRFFTWSLDSFGWLYQIISLVVLLGHPGDVVLESRGYHPGRERGQTQISFLDLVCHDFDRWGSYRDRQLGGQ